jgi:hypothetical protein
MTVRLPRVNVTLDDGLLYWPFAAENINLRVFDTGHFTGTGTGTDTTESNSLNQVYLTRKNSRQCYYNTMTYFHSRCGGRNEYGFKYSKMFRNFCMANVEALWTRDVVGRIC